MNEMSPQECAEQLEMLLDWPTLKNPIYTDAVHYSAALCHKLAAGELVEVVHAHWNIVNKQYFCTACGDENEESTEFCPCCGADMDGKDDNNAK